MDKTVRILLAFGDGDSHGIRDVARELDLPKSTVSRLVLDLAEAHLLLQEPATGQYRLGAGVARLGQSYLEGLDVRSVAAPMMTDLQQRSGETVGLHVREGVERIVIAAAESRQQIRSGFTVGERLPMYTGAAGKVLLAYEPAEVRQDVLAQLDLVPLTEHTIVEPQALEAELELTRTRGYALSENEVSLQSASVAAPIFGGDDRICAAFVVTGPVFRMASLLQDLIEPTRSAADEVSSRLGSAMRS